MINLIPEVHLKKSQDIIIRLNLGASFEWQGHSSEFSFTNNLKINLNYY